MGTTSVQTRVAAPASRVFEVMADFRNAPQNIAAIKKLEVLTDGPIGKGTRFRETRLLMGKEATETMEITEFEPGHSYTLNCDSCGTLYTTKVEVREISGGTDLVILMHGKPHSFLAKVFSPLMFLVMGSTIRKCLLGDLEDIKRVAEGGAQSPGGVQGQGMFAH